MKQYVVEFVWLCVIILVSLSGIDIICFIGDAVEDVTTPFLGLVVKLTMFATAWVLVDKWFRNRL